MKIKAAFVTLSTLLLQADAFAAPKQTNEFQKISRKDFIASTFASSAMLLIGSSNPASAAYGTSSNIELPNYIEFLIEKNSSVDPSKILYKGADQLTQLSRISEASLRLNEIPAIAKEKKWSQVQGILTGPLGTLIQTMNTLVKSATDANAKEGEKAKKAAAIVKADIINISQEATKKNEAGVVKACEVAQKDLEAFAKLVF